MALSDTSAYISSTALPRCLIATMSHVAATEMAVLACLCLACLTLHLGVGAASCLMHRVMHTCHGLLHSWGRLNTTTVILAPVSRQCLSRLWPLSPMVILGVTRATPGLQCTRISLHQHHVGLFGVSSGCSIKMQHQDAASRA